MTDYERAMEFLQPYTRRELLDMGYTEMRNGKIVWIDRLTNEVARAATMYNKAYGKESKV